MNNIQDITSFQIAGGDPLLKLIAVDWLKIDNPVNNIALHPSSLVQVIKILM